MYIIELFLKAIDKIKNKKLEKEKLASIDYEEEKCSHFFVPIDSTGKILACSKCGMIYKLKKGEKNPFAEK